MFERVLLKVQEWRYGNIGLALAAGIAIFTIVSTLLQITGISGNIIILIITLYLSTLIFFSILFYLLNHQYHRELQLGRRLIHANQSLTAQHSRIFGVVAPISYWSTEYYLNIIKSIRTAAEREQQSIRRKVVILDVPHEEFTDVEEIMTDLIIKDVSGLIMINMKMNQQVKQDFIDASIPVINVAHEEHKLPSVCSILHDHTGFGDLLKHILIEKKSFSAVLITKGLENPFKGVKTDPFRKEKRNLFTQAAGKAGLITQPVVKLSELNGKLTINEGMAYIVEIDQYLEQIGALFFEKLPDFTPPNTAFVFLADITAIGFLLACQNSGTSAKARRFRVSGFDNTKEAEWFDLTSVDAQLDIVGRLAYEKLQIALDHPDRFSYSQERVKTMCVIRGSSDW